MDSVDKLREAIERDVNNPWTDLKGDLLALVDKVEREIERDYMLLPKDADGVPIRVGDKMESDNETFVVCAVAPGRVHRWDIHNIGELDKGTVAYPPESLHHFKPRTVEDVLTEMLDRNTDGVGLREFSRDFDAFVAHYADEIRELLGGDAE